MSPPTPFSLPDGATDERGAQTALAVAVGGVLCPVPFVMSAAAMRIAEPRRTRAARAAYWLGAATIAAHAAGLVALVTVLAS